jgi:hypothetical protein
MSANLFKEGDKVVVKERPHKSERYSFVCDMSEWIGKTLTIHHIGNDYYRVEEDNNRWYWEDAFFEPAKKNIFAEQNAILLANGEIRLVHEERLYLPDGTSIGCEVYEGRKHGFDSNFDIVEVHEKATGNYLFELSGELIKED